MSERSFLFRSSFPAIIAPHVQVLATNGNTNLGGDDFDQRITRWLLESFQKDTGLDLHGVALQQLCGIEATRILRTRPRYGSFPKWGDPNIDPVTIILIIGTPKQVSLMLGNPHMFLCQGQAGFAAACRSKRESKGRALLLERGLAGQCLER